jgi:hypothetical protein
MSSESKTLATRILAAGFVAICLACDFLMMPVFASIDSKSAEYVFPFALGIIGCVIAQGNLLAAWLVWSPAPFLRRLALHWSIALGLYLVWRAGVALCSITEMGKVAATVGLIVPLVSLGAQFPLWVARQWFGWRLVKENADSQPPAEPPLTIRDLMLATFVVGTSLAIALLAPGIETDKEFRPVLVMGFTIASVISSIAMLPAGALVMRPRAFTEGLARGILYGGSYIALLWTIIIAMRFYGIGRLPPLAVCLGLSNFLLAFSATILLAAKIARDRGYRLTWKVGRSGP